MCESVCVNARALDHGLPGPSSVLWAKCLTVCVCAHAHAHARAVLAHVRVFVGIDQPSCGTCTRPTSLTTLSAAPRSGEQTDRDRQPHTHTKRPCVLFVSVCARAVRRTTHDARTAVPTCYNLTTSSGFLHSFSLSHTRTHALTQTRRAHCSADMLQPVDELRLRIAKWLRSRGREP